jgi:hypothetical protein
VREYTRGLCVASSTSYPPLRRVRDLENITPAQFTAHGGASVRAFMAPHMFQAVCFEHGTQRDLRQLVDYPKLANRTSTAGSKADTKDQNLYWCGVSLLPLKSMERSTTGRGIPYSLPGGTVTTTDLSPSYSGTMPYITGTGIDDTRFFSLASSSCTPTRRSASTARS